MNHSVRYTYNDIQRMLNTFSAKVSEGKYKKINYSDWRALQGFTSITLSIDISGTGRPFVRVTDGDAVINFLSDDSSLGSYLYHILTDNVKVVESKSSNYNKKTNIKKENKTMKGFNFDFGTCSGDNVRMSMYGLAVKNAAGTWVSYNAKDGSIIDVDVFNFDGGNYMFKMPVAIKDIAVGDIVVHNRTPMFVTDVTEGGKLSAVDVRAGEEKFIIPTTNMFGFNFVTKIVSMFNALGNSPTPDAPFGNMLPFLMMDGDNGDFDPMTMLMMMNATGGANGLGDIFSNPMVMYMMMKDEDSDISKFLPLMLMGGFNK